jgi:hypothetical protein
VGRNRRLFRLYESLGQPRGLETYDFQADPVSVGRWAAEAQSKIAVQIAAAKEHLPAANAEIPRLFPFGLSLEGLGDDAATARRARDAVELNLSRQRLEASRARLKDTRTRLGGSGGDIAEEMRIFVDELVGSAHLSGLEIAERWEALLRELARVRELAPQLASVEAVTGRISASGAPRWAERLVSQPVGGAEDLLAPSDWREAWSWAQQERFLKAIDGRVRISQLAKERLAAFDELERVFREVVRDRTFLMLNRSMTDLVRSALVMFASAIRQIGAGTGIRARRFRRDARDAMDRCYSAVPCWIMPTWRVSESLPSIPGSFDLVVIDEASQSDVLALYDNQIRPLRIPKPSERLDPPLIDILVAHRDVLGRRRSH